MSEVVTNKIENVSVESVWQAAEIKPKEVVPYPDQPADRRMAAAMFVLAYLMVDLIGIFSSSYYYGLRTTVFAVCYSIFIVAYAKMKQHKISREGFIWLAVILVNGLSYTLVYNKSLQWFSFLFLKLSMLYAPIIIFGVGAKRGTSNFLLLDGLNMLFLIPYQNIRAQWKLTRSSMKQVKVAGVLIKALIGIVVSLPLFLIVANLLSAADGVFESLLIEYVQNIGERIFEKLWLLIISLPVGCYLFALVYGCVHKRGTDTVKKERVIDVCKVFAVAPEISVYAALTGICLLYVMFIYLQGGYYISTMRGILPAGFTYSEYARRGFFELLQISLLNMAILCGVELFSRSKGRVIKIYRIIISVLTIFLIGTAMAKMMLYIDAHGLTPLRVIPSVFMLFLVVVFMLIIVSQFKPLPIVRISVCVFALGFSAMSVANMDGLIIRYNLARYQAGTLTEVSEITLHKCGLAGIPELYRAWAKASDPQQKEMYAGLAEAVNRNGDYWEYGVDDWRNINTVVSSLDHYLTDMNIEY